MKLYIFGGSFDPPHLGHPEIALKCLSHCDKFIFIPAKHAPQKAHIPYGTPTNRVQMLQEMIYDKSKIEIEHYELNSDKPNYSIYTIKYLKLKYPDAEITMVIGADQMTKFHTWYKWEEILKEVRILCFNRNNIKVDLSNYSNVKFIEDFNMDIASDKIRESYAFGEENGLGYLHPMVITYIKKTGLYR